MAKATRNAIMNAFLALLSEHSLDEITVMDIADRACVNRNTFYYHFEDIYDLIDEIFKDEVETFKAGFTDDSDFESEFARAASMFYQNKKAIINIYNSKNRYVLESYMEAAAKLFVDKFVRMRAEGRSVPEEGIQYITRFFTYAIVGSTMHWVSINMPGGRERLQGPISATFEVTCNALIDELCRQHT